MGSIRRHNKYYSGTDTVSFDHFLHMGRWDFYSLPLLDNGGIYDIEEGKAFKEPKDFFIDNDIFEFEGPYTI